MLGGGVRFVREHGGRVLLKLRDAVRIYYNKKWVLVCALLLTVCLQSAGIVAMWLIGSQIGMKVHFKYYFIFFPVSWLLGALPISVGGAGIMELWLKDIFVRVCHVSSSSALALALCQRIVWLVTSLPGVVIHLLGGHLPDSGERK